MVLGSDFPCLYAIFTSLEMDDDDGFNRIEDDGVSLMEAEPDNGMQLTIVNTEDKITSKYRGVTYNKKSRKWQAVINTGGKVSGHQAR